LQSAQSVRNILECGDDDGAILGFGLVERCLSRLLLVIEREAIEDGRGRTGCERIKSGSGREALRKIEAGRSAQSMSRIVGQLLDIAELDVFAVDPNDGADLREVCAEVVEFIAPLALEQNKDVALLGADIPVWVKGNREMLSRAIRNLAENAIKHTPRGTVVEFTAEQNGTVKVADRGPGIAEKERDLIFRRFWRRDRSQSGSTGLGLSIVRRIVDLHGATIQVENRVRGGAQFSLCFVKLETADDVPR
jgi:signal transduction histidine kinase